MTAILETKGLHKTFGALAVTRNVDFTLPRGARHALIGPNGAGKTTLVNLITGIVSPSSGRILLNGKDITGLKPAARVKQGIARTFQINTLFNGLSVLDNVSLAVAERLGVAWNMIRPIWRYSDVSDEAHQLLGSLNLESQAGRRVKELAYGQQRLVEIAVALASKPSVLLLDEPAAGIPTHDSAIIFEAMTKLPKELSILMIEHDMDMVSRFANRVTVLVQGEILVEGSPRDIFDDRRVQEVYLGKKVYGALDAG